MNPEQRIGSWLSDLATLTAGSAPVADAKVKIAALAGMLTTEFPPDAFTRDSLQHVARACTFFPSYAELTRALSGWWREHKSDVQAKIGTETSEMPLKMRFWIKYWERRKAENFAPLRDKTGALIRTDITDWRAHCAGLVRSQSPEAWAYIRRPVLMAAE
jgi:hypothetical protein